MDWSIRCRSIECVDRMPSCIVCVGMSRAGYVLAIQRVVRAGKRRDDRRVGDFRGRLQEVLDRFALLLLRWAVALGSA